MQFLQRSHVGIVAILKRRAKSAVGSKANDSNGSTATGAIGCG